MALLDFVDLEDMFTSLLHSWRFACAEQHFPKRKSQKLNIFRSVTSDAIYWLFRTMHLPTLAMSGNNVVPPTLWEKCRLF
jgi:hypothetical protein